MGLLHILNLAYTEFKVIIHACNVIHTSECSLDPGGEKTTLFKDSEYSPDFIINYHFDLLFI